METLAAPTPKVEVIEEGWRRHISSLKPPRASDARDYVYASSRRACQRRMVHECINPEFFPDFDVETKAKFIRGEQREIDIRQALERVGQLSMPSFNVIGQQERISIYDRQKRKVISGKIDGKIQWESKTLWPFEVKSWSPFLTDSIFKFADLFESPWTKAGAFQLLSYLYAMEQPYGLLILDRPGIPRLIQVDLEPNIHLMEEFLRDAESVREHIDAGTLPDFIDDPKECRRCPLIGAHCNPPLSYAGAKFITDDETLMMIQHHEDTYEAKNSYDKTHKKLAEIINDLTPKEVGKDDKTKIVAGRFVIDAWRGKSTTAKLPDDVKKQYTTTDPFGKFYFEITEVDKD